VSKLPAERLTLDDLKKEHFQVDNRGNVTIKSEDLAKAIKDKVLDPGATADIRVAVDTG
jgi:hypothetical protein